MKSETKICLMCRKHILVKYGDKCPWCSSHIWYEKYDRLKADHEKKVNEMIEEIKQKDLQIYWNNKAIEDLKGKVTAVSEMLRDYAVASAKVVLVLGVKE